MNWIGNYEYKVENIHPGYAANGATYTINHELEHGWLLVGFCQHKHGDGGIFARLRKM